MNLTEEETNTLYYLLGKSKHNILDDSYRTNMINNIVNIDPENISEGTGVIVDFNIKGKAFITKEDGKLKIYPIVKEK